MTQLTIRGFDPELEEKIRELAASEGISLNQAVLRLLRKAAHVAPARVRTNIGSSLDDLAGTWTEQQEREFLAAIRPFESTDDEFWR